MVQDTLRRIGVQDIGIGTANGFKVARGIHYFTLVGTSPVPVHEPCTSSWHGEFSVVSAHPGLLWPPDQQIRTSVSLV
jgi:hypothetical protein